VSSFHQASTNEPREGSASDKPQPVNAAREIAALRDAIAAEVWNARIHSDCGHNAADAILAMPEMQAIQEFLRARSFDSQCEFFGLPTSVVDWALS
jgi:hypothetical protein